MLAWKELGAVSKLKFGERYASLSISRNFAMKTMVNSSDIIDEITRLVGRSALAALLSIKIAPTERTIESSNNMDANMLRPIKRAIIF